MSTEIVDETPTIPDMGLKDRLQAALDDMPGMTQAELARRLGVTRASVSNWLSGTTKTLRGENLLRVAQELRVSPKWLQQGVGPKTPANLPGYSGEHTYTAVRRIRMLNWTEASEFDGVVGAGATIPVVGDFSPETFAVQFHGVSMEPRVPDGAILIVDPEGEPEHGALVLIRIPGEPAALLRKLVFEGGIAYLKTLHPENITRKPDHARIIGVVRRIQVDA